MIYKDMHTFSILINMNFTLKISGVFFNHNKVKRSGYVVTFCAYMKGINKTIPNLDLVASKTEK